MKNRLNLKDIKSLGLHDGEFHADDVLAAAMVKICNTNVQIIRSRDERKLKQCDLLVDVGFGKYDHHQVNKRVHLDSNIPYCGAGLLWEDYAEEIICSLSPTVDNIESVKHYVSFNLLIYIDGMDNGYDLLNDKEIQGEYITFTEMIASFVVFEEAVDFAEAVLNSIIRGYIERSECIKIINYRPEVTNEIIQVLEELKFPSRQRDKVIKSLHTLLNSYILYSDMNRYKKDSLKCYFNIPSLDWILSYLGQDTYFKIYIKNYLQKEIQRINEAPIIKEAYIKALKDKVSYITLNEYLPYIKTLKELDIDSEIDYVVFYQPNSNSYCVKCIADNYPKFSAKRYFPEAWGGLQDKELINVSGIPDLVFCHTGQTFLVSKTLQGILTALKETKEGK